tara:strand:- start:602 stop:1351 length:750 start_codon:yes stop_codon:yes gene_type:complete
LAKSSKILLELSKISLKHGNIKRLSNINISISSGEKIALLGKSGSGKTTLISIANGSLRPSQGDIKWLGKDIQLIKRNQKIEIATIWQDLRLLDELNVQQNINIGALGRKSIFWALRNLIGNIETKRCNLCLKAAGLEDSFLNSKLTQLSGGQLQRIAIARSLRQKAKIILADEPLKSLDPKMADYITDLLLNNNQNSQLLIPETCLISLHRTELTKKFTRVIGIRKGEIVIDMPVKIFGQSELKLIYN